MKKRKRSCFSRNQRRLQVPVNLGSERRTSYSAILKIEATRGESVGELEGSFSWLLAALWPIQNNSNAEGTGDAPKHWSPAWRRHLVPLWLLAFSWLPGSAASRILLYPLVAVYLCLSFTFSAHRSCFVDLLTLRLLRRPSQCEITNLQPSSSSCLRLNLYLLTAAFLAHILPKSPCVFAELADCLIYGFCWLSLFALAFDISHLLTVHSKRITRLFRLAGFSLTFRSLNRSKSREAYTVQ